MKKITIVIAGVLSAGSAAAITGLQLVQPVYDVVCLFKDAVENTIGALAAILFVYAGIKWITSEEVEEQLHARDILVYTIIGLILLGVIGGITRILFPNVILSCI
ncbi:MAG: hypothetical protein V1921_00810 [Candidatus Altiarchaeota archaeon]